MTFIDLTSNHLPHKGGRTIAKHPDVVAAPFLKGRWPPLFLSSPIRRSRGLSGPRWGCYHNIGAGFPLSIPSEC